MVRRKRTRHPKALDCARKMPPMRHSFDGEDFDIAYSEVAEWLSSRPEIRQYVFDKANAAGVIVFDAKSGTWRGKDWSGE